ncbi:hypothetical protein [Winogradskyella immobilis]|uniref:Uncharacterized protein n=1 Tax=Winogradskyella immobilis TaxID=2816852 RepID=A0ABS8ERB3_9FLAO|nr:hypothetical protein [Winogradskyella immobilis]MCC1485075.1 hypothetical protein [Winogradskyella immobilis]MCG0017167.1 hypothetical protein [Winogradskyella immobilis]
MKVYILTIIVCFSFCTTVNAQKEASLLNSPNDWRAETLNLPLSFAPELDYEGIEYVRFAKGWGNAASEEFWTYKFAWYLDVDPKLTTERLNKELKLYFDGLLNAVGKGKGLSKETIIPAKATIAYNKESASYLGNVTIFDVFFKEALQTLNVKITSSYCDITKKHIVYFEFSPQPYQHKLWETMNNITILCK